MTAASVYRVDVLPGDCGPDRVVLADRYSRWLDAAAQEHLRACGVPLWRHLDPSTGGVLGTLLVDARLTFEAAARPDDMLFVHTWVDAWHADDVVLAHRVMRGDTVVCRAHETRALCAFDGAGHAQRVPMAVAG